MALAERSAQLSNGTIELRYAIFIIPGRFGQLHAPLGFIGQIYQQDQGDHKENVVRVEGVREFIAHKIFQDEGEDRVRRKEQGEGHRQHQQRPIGRAAISAPKNKGSVDQ